VAAAARLSEPSGRPRRHARKILKRQLKWGLANPTEGSKYRQGRTGCILSVRLCSFPENVVVGAAFLLASCGIDERKGRTARLENRVGRPGRVGRARTKRRSGATRCRPSRRNGVLIGADPARRQDNPYPRSGSERQTLPCRDQPTSSATARSRTSDTSSRRIRREARLESAGPPGVSAAHGMRFGPLGQAELMTGGSEPAARTLAPGYEENDDRTTKPGGVAGIQAAASRPQVDFRNPRRGIRVRSWPQGRVLRGGCPRWSQRAARPIAAPMDACRAMRLSGQPFEQWRGR